MATVGVKFCGGCNPAIDRTKVFQEVCDLVGELTFACPEVKDPSALLFICGCPTACPVEQLGLHGHPRLVVVAGQTVNGQSVPEAFIARLLVDKLGDLLRGKV